MTTDAIETTGPSERVDEKRRGTQPAAGILQLAWPAIVGNLLREGFENRRVPGAKRNPTPTFVPTSAVSWANHLDPEATRIKLDLAELARVGDPPTGRLRADWRKRMEDVLWALVNSPEFLFIP